MKKTKQAYINIISIVISTTLLSAVAYAKDNEVLDISGYLMLDHDSFAATFLENGHSTTDDSESQSEVRRARLSVKSQLADHLEGKVQLGFADGNTKIKDAFVKYTGWNWADITLGKHKEAFGLEKLTSSRNLLMIERSMVSEALAPGRSIGVSATGDFSSLNWQLGYFQPNESESASAVTGRLTWTPWQQNNNLVHLGLAFSERDLNGSDFRINETLEVHSADSLLEGKKLIADKQSLQGLEFLWQVNGFTTMAEWQQASVRDINDSDYDYEGGYVQLSYQFSGENRKYKNGSLKQVAAPGWEITTRYSQFELIEETREAETYAIGVNYTVNKHLKIMADYIKAKHYEAGTEFDSGEAVSLRVQYSF